MLPLNERVQQLTKGDPYYTTKHPRPTQASEPVITPEALAAKQEAWDEAEARRQQLEATAKRFREQREARETAECDAYEAEQAKVRAQKDEAFVADLRHRYLAADPLATEADFLEALPEIRRQHRVAATLNMDEDHAARAVHRRAIANA